MLTAERHGPLSGPTPSGQGATAERLRNKPAGRLLIALSHVDEAKQVSLVTELDQFVRSPGGSVSKVYEVPGEVVVLSANAQPPQTSGIRVFFTVYGWTD